MNEHIACAYTHMYRHIEYTVHVFIYEQPYIIIPHIDISTPISTVTCTLHRLTYADAPYICVQQHITCAETSTPRPAIHECKKQVRGLWPTAPLHQSNSQGSVQQLSSHKPWTCIFYLNKHQRSDLLTPNLSNTSSATEVSKP